MGEASLLWICVFRCWSLASSAGVIFCISASRSSMIARSAREVVLPGGQVHVGEADLDLAADLFVVRSRNSSSSGSAYPRIAGALSVEARVASGPLECFDLGECARASTCAAGLNAQA